MVSFFRGAEVFLSYSNLLIKEGHHVWNKIVKGKVDSIPRISIHLSMVSALLSAFGKLLTVI
jgi:hypothetical protein